MPAARVDDYGLIGDGRSAALVSSDGSIDWLCWPRFDSPSVFGALVGGEAGGRWRIGPTAAATVTRRYIEDTAVLETRFQVGGATLLVIDLMPVPDERERASALVPERELVRHVRCDGEPVEVEVDFAPRPDFGRVDTRAVKALGPLGFRIQHGSRVFTLLSDAKLIRHESGAVGGRLFLRPGETRTFSLTYHEAGPAVLGPPVPVSRDRIERTLAYWRLWSARTRYAGRFREAVHRSLVTLRLLAYPPTGALIAAPTLGVPLGGRSRSPDDRYAPVGHARRAIRAFLELGHEPEAVSYAQWLVAATRSARRRGLRPVYDLDGRTVETAPVPLAALAADEELDPPVAGTAHGRERHLASYGEVAAALSDLVRKGPGLDRNGQAVLRTLAHHVAAHWREPDAAGSLDAYLLGYTQSLALSWLGLERVLELHESGKLPGLDDAARLAVERERMREELLARLGSSDAGDEASRLDASPSALALAEAGLVPASAAGLKALVARVHERLGAGPGLLRGDARDTEQAPSALGGFWVAEALALGAGSLDEAGHAFTDALGHANDLGLLSAVVDPSSGLPAGSFPHAPTHLALLDAARALAAREAAEGRPPSARERLGE